MWMCVWSSGSAGEPVSASSTPRSGVGTASTQPAYEELIRRGYTPDLAAILYTPEEFQNTKPIFLDLVEEAILKAGTVEIFVAELVQRYLRS